MSLRLIVVLLIALVDARGATPIEPSLRDYVHTAWTQHEGVPLSSIADITQTTDGYLWITTSEEGLLRFDGVRFVSVPSPCERPGTVTQAESDGAGGLWLLCSYRLFHRDASGRTVAVKQNLLPPELRPSMVFYVDRRGRLWLWGHSLAYLRPDQSEGPEIPGTERPTGATYCRFAEDSDGNLWFAAAGSLMRIRDDRAERVATGSFTALAPSHSGGIIALQEKSLLHVHDGSISTIADFDRELQPTGSASLVETEHAIWFGTQNRGVALLRHGRIETFGRQEGLSSGNVTALRVDREGTVWVGTPLGLHRFREPLAYLMSPADGLPSRMAQFVYQDSRNGLWIGSSARTVRIDRGSGRAETIESDYRCIAEDKTGRIWLATQSELGYLQGNRFVPVRDSAGSPITNVSSLSRDDRGDLWALSSPTGLYRVVNGRPVREIAGERFAHDFLISGRSGVWIGLRGGGILQILNRQETVFGAESGLAAGMIEAIYDDGGSVWLGADRGLSRWRNGKWTTWTIDHGLPGRGDVHEITSDAQGRLWLMSGGGILVLDRAQLDGTPDAQPRRLAYLRIGSLDRVIPHRGGITTSPRVTKDRDGRLFFATIDSIAVVDPAHLSEPSFMPPIVLETVLIDRRPVTQGVASRFVKPEDVQFEYTSLSLRNPENVRFRYRLEGYDKDWIDAGTQRRATYGSLKPGSYRFRVTGSGSEGVWNEAGAAYTFQIVAPFYETPLFLFAAVSVVVAFAWSIDRYRLRLAADRIRLRMDAQAGERMRIAQEMHDSFLQGIQGSALMVHAAIAKLEDESPESRRLLDRALEMVAHSTEQARHMLSSLRAGAPPRASLTARLESMVAQEIALYQNPPRMVIESSDAARELRPPVDKDVYLIASEALRNALRHAGARSVRMTIRFQPGEFQLTVADDGIGIEPEIQEGGRSGHFGLHGMRERAERHAGVLKIKSRKGEGTELRLSLAARKAYL